VKQKNLHVFQIFGFNFPIAGVTVEVIKMFSVRQNVSFVTNLHCVYVSLIYMANLSFFEFKISAFSVPD